MRGVYLTSARFMSAAMFTHVPFQRGMCFPCKRIKWSAVHVSDVHTHALFNEARARHVDVEATNQSGACARRGLERINESGRE